LEFLGQFSKIKSLHLQKKKTDNRFRKIDKTDIIFICACIIYFSENTLISALGPFFPEYAKLRCDASKTAIGLIVSAFPFACMIASPVCGILAHRFGRRKILYAGLFLLCFSTLFFGISLSLPAFFSARVLQGIASALINVGSYSLWIDTSSNLTAACAICEIFTGLGYMVGPPLGAFMYSVGGFQATFAILAFVPLSMFLLLFPILEKGVSSKRHTHTPAEPSSETTRGQLSLSIKSWNNVLCTMYLTNVIAIASCGFTGPIISKHFELVLGASVNTSGFLMGLPSMVYTVSAMVTPSFTAKFGEPFTLMVGFLLVGFSYTILGPAPFLAPLFHARIESWCIQIFSLVISGIGMAFSMIPILPIMQKSLRQGVENHSFGELATSLYASSCSAGEFIGPIAGGFLDQAVPQTREITCFHENCHNGFPWTAYLFGGVNIICAISLFVFKPIKSEYTAVRQCEDRDSDIEATAEEDSVVDTIATARMSNESPHEIDEKIQNRKRCTSNYEMNTKDM